MLLRIFQDRRDAGRVLARTILESAAGRDFQDGIVLGLPLDLDGRDNPRAQSTRAFARNLSTRTSLPIVFWDERFSTAVVNRSLIANDVSRGRRAQVIDKMAAVLILQSFLDARAANAAMQRGT